VDIGVSRVHGYGLVSMVRMAAALARMANGARAARRSVSWAPLATVGSIITKQAPDFDSRNYGYSKLSDLIAATTPFDLDWRNTSGGNPTSSMRATNATSQGSKIIPNERRWWLPPASSDASVVQYTWPGGHSCTPTRPPSR